MSKFVEYVTRAGDRWDLIAFKHYGDAAAMAPIVDANPHIPIDPLLESGLRVLVPIVEEAEVMATDELPPWKRG